MAGIELRYYQGADGKQPLVEWLNGLRDERARSKIRIRLDRLALGSFGDCEAVGGGVIELRIDWGPGYRVYCARLGQVVVLLLTGGDKSRQQKDIKRAKDCFEDCKIRSARKPKTRGRA